MKWLRPSSYGRTAIALVLLGIGLSLAGGTYLIFANADALVPPPVEVQPDRTEIEINAARRLVYKLSILLATVLIILVFVIGAYLVIRVGRAVTSKPVGGTATEYVDIWSRYRLTDEQIDSATREPGAAGGSGRRPDDPKPGGHSGKEPGDR